MLRAMEMGIFLAFVYDLFRLFRRVIPHGAVWVAAEDLLFWCFCGGETFWLLHVENNGVLRWFAVAAAVAGIWAYLRLASPPFLKYGSAFLKKLLTRLDGLLRIIGKGVIWLGSKLFKCTKKHILRERNERKRLIGSLSRTR